MDQAMPSRIDTAGAVAFYIADIYHYATIWFWLYREGFL